jgi:3-deoxy-D-manno-octulosonic-acid transferase
LQVILYNIFLFLYRAGISVASLFDAKAKKWVVGRRDLLKRMELAIPPNEPITWMHCASLGEFEQGRPVMEELKRRFPAQKILLTFFSPSGFEAQKNYKGADWVFYLPLDGPRKAKRFLDIVHPSLVIFVKYEFWFFYLKKIKYRNIPLLLISALFRKDMSFFKWYGGLQQKMLARFDRLFVQNLSSKKLLDEIGLADITAISGDTRFDRVMEIAGNHEPLPLIENFIGDAKTIVAGSTWPSDEALLQKSWEQLEEHNLKLIIAPHEIDPKHIEQLMELFPGAVLYSSLQKENNSNNSVLIIDNIGMLSRLYRYSWISYVGGGFIKMGVHNVLEPAVQQKPVLMGPFYKKYYEAIELVESGGGIPVKNEKELVSTVNRLRSIQDEYTQKAAAAYTYVKQHAGATNVIINYIQEKRLLTS